MHLNPLFPSSWCPTSAASREKVGSISSPLMASASTSSGATVLRNNASSAAADGTSKAIARMFRDNEADLFMVIGAGGLFALTLIMVHRQLGGKLKRDAGYLDSLPAVRTQLEHGSQ